MERQQFTFFASFRDALRRIRKKQDRCDAYDVIVEYALTGIEPDMDSISDAAAMAFILVKPTLDSSRRKAENRIKSRTNEEQTDNKPTSNDEGGGERVRERGGERDRVRDRVRVRERMLKDTSEEKTASKKTKPKDIAFDRFWEVYPKKVGKGDARRAFDKVKVDVEDLIAAVERQKGSDQWTRDGGRYIPNPSTWLNQGRWEDELAAGGDHSVQQHGAPMGPMMRAAVAAMMAGEDGDGSFGFAQDDGGGDGDG